MSWRDFWNGTHSIYVNDRHRALHYYRIASDIVGLIPSREACVLDHGCGDAESSDAVARACATLYLYDAASNVQERLRLHFSRNDKIVVLSTDALALIADQSLDLVVVNSLLQYLTPQEFEALLPFWRMKLKDTGKLVVADVIPRDASAIDDVRALLGFAWEGGFLVAALGGLVATFFSNYRKLRDEIGLTQYAPAEMLSLLAASGFKASRAPRNIGHNQSRMMFVATKSA